MRTVVAYNALLICFDKATKQQALTTFLFFEWCFPFSFFQTSSLRLLNAYHDRGRRMTRLKDRRKKTRYGGRALICRMCGSIMTPSAVKCSCLMRSQPKRIVAMCMCFN